MNKEEPKFTPGPWQKDGFKVFDGNSRRRMVAECGLLGYSDEEAEANAALIAVVPKMYQKLECLSNYLADNVDWLERRLGNVMFVAVLRYQAEEIRKLLAKARDEEDTEEGK